MKTLNEPQDQGQVIPPAIAQRMEQLTTEAQQQAHAFAQSLHEQLQTKQPELDVKLKLAQMDLDFKREQLAVTAAIGEAQAKNALGIEQLRQEIRVIMHERGLTAEAAAQKDQQAHELQAAAIARANHANQPQPNQPEDALPQAA